MSARTFVSHRMFVAALGGSPAPAPRAARENRPDANARTAAPLVISDPRFSDSLPAAYPPPSGLAAWAAALG